MSVVPTLFLTGPPGAGKSTIGAQLSSLLHDPPVSHAFIDIDSLSAGFPPPSDDRFNQRLALRNLRDVWRNFAAAGATHLILAGVLESREALSGYERAVPNAAITVVRLWAPVETVHARLRHRYEGLGADRDASWHINRAAELAPLMEKEAVEDVLVHTDGRTAMQVAEAVLTRLGWSP